MGERTATRKTHRTERPALARIAEILADLEADKNRQRDWHDIRRHQ